MKDSLLPAAAPSWDAPLDLLDACHGRIEAQCATLLRLAAHVGVKGADEPARQAAAGILRYFATAARHHHEDEEADLFPLLRRRAEEAGEADAARALTSVLEAEHRRMETAWAGLRPVLETLAAGGEAPLDGVACAAFVALYRAHIARETADLLPLSRRLLSAADAGALGRAMAARRGVDITSAG